MKALSILSLALLAGAIGAGPAAADKTCYQISTMKYKNAGAYTAKKFYVMYENAKGEKQEDVGLAFDTLTGETRSVDLTEVVGLKSGYETWGKVNIEGGDREGCRKDGNVFYYNRSGGTVTYKTGGTTLNNNRCELNNKPGDQHIIDCP